MNRFGMRICAGAVALLLVGGAGFATSPSAAADTPSNPQPQYCSLNIETGQQVCVDQEADLAKAVLDQTGYTLLPVSQAPKPGARSVTPMATYIIGELYTWPQLRRHQVDRYSKFRLHVRDQADLGLRDLRLVERRRLLQELRRLQDQALGKHQLHRIGLRLQRQRDRPRSHAERGRVREVDQGVEPTTPPRAPTRMTGGSRLARASGKSLVVFP